MATATRASAALSLCFAVPVLAASDGGAGVLHEAPSEDEANSSVRLTPEQTFSFAVQMEEAGNVELAERVYKSLRQVRSAELRREARFRLAMLYKRQERLTDAALELRAILDEQPDVARVRLELASILAAMGDMGAARRELRAVLALDLPPQVANQVTAISNALRARKPLGATLSVGLARDSNINRATRADTLESVLGDLQLSEDSQATSGLGISLDGQVYLRQPLARNVSLLARMSGRGDVYTKTNDFNDISLDAQIGPEIASGRDRISASIGVGRRWYGGRLYTKSVTGQATLLHPVGKRSQMVGRVAISDVDNQFNDLQDGTVFSGSLGLERALSARSGAGLTLSAVRQDLNDAGYASTQLGVSAFVYREFGSVTATASAQYYRLRADERLLIFPERRRDDRYLLSLTGNFRKLQLLGFSPFSRVGFEENTSSIGLYDFDRFFVEFGMTRAF